jgi:hypothetical protein
MLQTVQMVIDAVNAALRHTLSGAELFGFGHYAGPLRRQTIDCGKLKIMMQPSTCRGVLSFVFIFRFF